MKLLLDENLSRRLVPALQARFPGTTQIALIGLERATDRAVAEFARTNDFVLVSKDDDFQRLVASMGYRPKLIRISLGNVSNDRVVETLLGAADDLEKFIRDPDIGIVTLG